MSHLYKCLNLFSKVRSRRFKLFGILVLHLLKRRYVGIFIDPTLACNFRCRMCYFSDEEKRSSLHGSLSAEDIEHIAKAFFHRALKLQIGCGAEPTTSKHLVHLISKGKEYGVPYISITTNGGLLNSDILGSYVCAGLDELTLSCHGVKKETYEYFMPGGKYEHFVTLLNDVASLKQKYPSLKVRINYTMNEDNVEELKKLSHLLAKTSVDILQVRPIRKIGKSAYLNFSVDRIVAFYNNVLEPLKEYCGSHGIICIMPTIENLYDLHEKIHPEDQYIKELLYCYISPQSCWREDFDTLRDSFDSYCKRHGRITNIIKHIFNSSYASAHDEVTPQKVVS